MIVTFSNPRITATIPDWPCAGQRIPCTFAVEHRNQGWRVSRTLNGRPKYSTYSGPSCIVDGSDGKTYILASCVMYSFVRIARSDFKDAVATEIGHDAAVFARSEKNADAELFVTLMNLITKSKAEEMPCQ